MPEEKSAHEKAATSQPHDTHGRFTAKPASDPSSQQTSSSRNPLSRLFDTKTTVSPKGTDDNLLDIHVGNPLRRITALLEEIRRQKAFSFTLKGSLGVMGVVLVAGTFGILGGSKLLCDKGRQSHIGSIKILAAKEEVSPLPFFGGFLTSSMMPFGNVAENRVILVKNDQTTITIATSNLSWAALANLQVVATGQYDSCSQVLKVTSTSDRQPYP